ncbi:zinc metalloproteinase-disintegrin-like scutiarin [Thamnophis elegans]|uniref:zinc metalloproteinase-disintegrin-like scutiarin n=1 Tax=Thamnophis elegans TaxID=35005 RepID=UPI001376B79B|nr:zinc metalloproteinase-disintegrin-like scutiarin [Thamnophis elegans]
METTGNALEFILQKCQMLDWLNLEQNVEIKRGIDFKGSTVGYAPIGSLCMSKESVAIIQDHSKEIHLMATTMAHELGHNLGINHDTNGCNCSANICIMSQQLKKYQISLFHIDMPSTVYNNKPFDCQSTCCDAATCKLKPGAQCDAEECCEQCRFKSARTVCRPAKDDCDEADLCTGQSAECPTDSFKRNGEPCQNNQGYCYNGKCPTMHKQCLVSLNNSPYANVAPDECYNIYNQGRNDFGYCRRENGVKIPCGPQDVKCGRLYCRYGNNRECLRKYFPEKPDVGLVEPGTKCGDGRVCSNGYCVDVRIAYRSTTGFSII